MAPEILFQEKWDNVFKILGFMTFSYTISNLFYTTINNLVAFSKDIKSIDFKKYGSWAIVTGCTDGIGKVYFNIIYFWNNIIVII
jgi:hypothetical protein